MCEEIGIKINSRLVILWAPFYHFSLENAKLRDLIGTKLFSIDVLITGKIDVAIKALCMDIIWVKI
jgi:hypothetical protein